MGQPRVAITAALTALGAIAALLVATPAIAEEPPPSRMPARVRVDGPACARPPFEVRAFLDLLQIELRGDGIASVADAGTTADDPALATVTIAIDPCDPEARDVTVGIASARERRGVIRSVSIGDTPLPARPRVLALAVAELLRSLWPALSAPPTPPPAGPSPIAPPDPTRAPARPIVPIAPASRHPSACPPPACPKEPSPARAHVWAAFDARTLIGSGTFGGGRIGASIALSSRIPILLTLDGGALYGRAFDRLGTVDVVVASGEIGLAGRVSMGRAILEIGPSIELGGLFARGHAYASTTTASSGSDFVIATSAEASVRGRLADRLWLGAALRGGAVLKGATLFAGGREASGFAGAMLGIRAGVGVDF